MTSKERVRAAISFKSPDRVPVDYAAADCVTENLMRHYGLNSFEKLVDKLQIDIIEVTPAYIGPELIIYADKNGNRVEKSWWGYESTFVKTGNREYGNVSYYPLNNASEPKDIDQFNWPNPDWFDYDSIKRQCDLYKNKAIVVGSAGPFQYVTFLMEMSKFFINMVEYPEFAELILDKMVEFELEYYQRILEAADGQIDILRPCDDYGTQISMLFSKEMWRMFFKKNTIKLVNLAHNFDAFYMQHSCGAIEPLIDEFIDCGVDALDPLQKVDGLNPENLWQKYGGRITFHGGIDTQNLLPLGTPADVENEVKRYINQLNKNGGYILMASQSFEPDIPIENIETLYSIRRN